ncbi:SprT family protein [Salisediminibacterium beveridgei]|uniref:Protein SprT-like n=1 Tax=Salisediminibacterium beveridgei TaxID=632773 RepID=A0A1D7QYN5_9BACI|nr:SprT family protein [Salisediminibacterium beveridgei]AOM84126.1 Putative metallopeptidase (Zinc) SprT family [Salisediminibacterium beveridgei]
MTNDELQLRTEHLSERFFNRPFKHNIRFNARLRTTGGRYLLKSHNIEINPKQLAHFGEDALDGIIKHELCHYHLHLEGKGYQHRDQDFKQWIEESGATRYCQLVPGTRNRSEKLHIYRCKDCNQKYERRRRMDVSRYVCGKCKGKLKLIETFYMETIDGE